jgi:hypothetical protein
MSCFGHDLQRFGSSQSGQRLLIELDDAEIGAADDQKRRCLDLFEGISGEIGAPAARDHGTDPARQLRRRDQRRGRSGTSTEQAERELCHRRLAVEPEDSIDKTVRQQRDVEYVGAVGFFRGGQ